ncbi:collagen alpha-1(XIII) chain-like [Hoplias malabaricus]|uniref:collagen alpha-1(XIII) chain-like n=1 Tax=Hoplias malabaricus TaxID=27720 RepID=UPI003463588A
MEDAQKCKLSRHCAGESTCGEHPCRRRTAASRADACAAVVSTALSLVAFGICVLVYLRTSELQSRVLSLEKHREPELAGWVSLEQVEPILLSRLDQMLEEKLASRLPKTRETREAPPSCLCPPVYGFLLQETSCSYCELSLTHFFVYSVIFEAYLVNALN